jgi:hypothetical protein
MLTDGKVAVRMAVMAERLSMSEKTVIVANHRLRRRIRDLLLQEMTAGLDVPSELVYEIRSLFSALRLQLNIR